MRHNGHTANIHCLSAQCQHQAGEASQSSPAYSFHVLPGIPNPQHDEGSIAVINTMTERKQLREGQDWRGLHFHIRASSRSHRVQCRRNLEAETESEALEECCSLTICSSYTARPTSPTMAPQWVGPPTSVSNQEKASQTYPQANLIDTKPPQSLHCSPLPKAPLLISLHKGP